MLAHQYYEGNTQWGGYFIIKNLELMPAAEQREMNGNAAELQYLDLYMLVGNLDEDGYEYLKSMNATEDDSDASHSICCFMSSEEGGQSVQPLVSGLVRALVYTKNDWGSVTNVQIMIEGNIRDGDVQGFGRAIYGDMNAHFIGHLSGSKAYYKGMYYKNGKFQHMGLYDEISPFGEPSYKYNFTHFGVEDIIRVEPSPAEETAGEEEDNDENPSDPNGEGEDEDDEENDGLYQWCP